MYVVAALPTSRPSHPRGTGLPVFQESPPDPALSPPLDLGLLPVGKQWAWVTLLPPVLCSEQPDRLGSRPPVTLGLTLLICKWGLWCTGGLGPQSYSPGARVWTATHAGFDFVFGLTSSSCGCHCQSPRNWEPPWGTGGGSGGTAGVWALEGQHWEMPRVQVSTEAHRV